jgi:hypothetical protein
VSITDKGTMAQMGWWEGFIWGSGNLEGFLVT